MKDSRLRIPHVSIAIILACFVLRIHPNTTGEPWSWTYRKIIQPNELKASKNNELLFSKLNVPMFVTAGDYICTVSGTGKTVKESIDRAYKTIKDKIEIPNSIMYRTDIGKKLEKTLPKLQKMGYCLDMCYE